MPAPKVFLSSTFLEFREERKILHQVLTRVLGIACEMAEYLTPQSMNLEADLRKCIDASDIVVLLLGLRYGSLTGNISWTHGEIVYAVGEDKKIFPYIKYQPVTRTVLDVDEYKQNELAEFVEFIREKVSPSIPTCSTTETLIGLVVRDIVREMHEIETALRENSFDIDEEA